MASLPKDSTYMQLYGVAVLTGIGFTMSLFVDTLAYNDTDLFNYADKLAILLGSLFSGILGYSVLRLAKKKKKRYANGEITKEEFEQMKKDLQ